jgi:hypothetical protein
MKYLFALAIAALLLSIAAPATTDNVGFAKNGSSGGSPGTLTYHGGPLMVTNSVRVILWAPAGFTYGSGYTELIDRYFTDVAATKGSTDNVYGVLPQYNVQNNTTYEGMLVDTNPYPPRACSGNTWCISSTQIRAELPTFLRSQGVGPSDTRANMLFLPQGVSVCSGGNCSYVNMCGFHGWTLDSGHWLYGIMPYQPWPGYCAKPNWPKPNGNDADVVLSTASHEHIEMITDPFPYSGWADNINREIADRCVGNFGPQVINGNPYELQSEWSNLRGCVYSG